MENKRIGKVKIINLKHKLNDKYLDQSEEFLYGFFDKPQSQKQDEINKVLDSNPSWPNRYHLSPQREFLLEWYPFKKNSSLLEVGAGCGALTGLFCRKLTYVYSNEITSQRGEIIAKRFSDKNNLEVIIGNITSLNYELKVNYVVVVGVLEYAGRFIKVKGDTFRKPYVEFFMQIKKYLKPSGHLLLAIENKLGLKYIAGGKEDHYGNLFSSLENYPDYKGIRTFSKNEVITLLRKAGFDNINFYYPYPDYKLPLSIFSDEGIEKLNLSLSSYAHIVDFSNERLPLFNEVIFAENLASEGVLSKFANSFLIDTTV